MKRNLFCFLTICLAVALLGSCNKNITIATPIGPTYSISFKVDGVQKNMFPFTAEKVGIATGFKLIIGGAVGNEIFDATITNPQIGTFNISTPATLSMDYIADNTDKTNHSFFVANAGQLTITSLTPTSVSGTFQFSGSSAQGTPVVNKTITEGTFNCAVKQQ